MKLFNYLKVDEVTDSALEIASNKTSVTLTFKWTERMKIVIYQLNFRTKADKPWEDALHNKPIADDDGTQSVFIGDFEPGTEIEFNTEMMAITKVEKAALVISQDNPKTAFKIKPLGADVFKTLEVSEKWPEIFKYKVNAQTIV